MPLFGVASALDIQESNGLIVVDKPKGISSRAALDQVQAWFPKTRVGHTGTLDPEATGVLVVCLGQATRLAEYVQRMDKDYRAIVVFGVRSTTDDVEGTLTPSENVVPFDRESLDRELAGFLGEIDQVPPAFSAAKVSGRRAYKLARQGKEVSLEPRKVRVYELQVRQFAFPNLELEVRCGKGTYIRSLARDLGERLGCGAYLGGLCRTRVGPFRLESALPLNTPADAASRSVLPLAMALSELATVQLHDAEVIRKFRTGAAVKDHCPKSGPVQVMDAAGSLIGIGIMDSATTTLRPDKILAR